MEFKKEQKLTRLIGGPKDGEITAVKPIFNKIVIAGIGFSPESHLYKMSQVVDNEGDPIAVYVDPTSATDE